MNNLKKQDLFKKCEELNIKSYKSKSKKELIDLINNFNKIEIKEIDYSDLSINLTKLLTKEEKSNNGIFFTPIKTIKLNLELLKDYLNNIKTILEPSCGSCEFIFQLNKLNFNFDIVGVEKNKTIFNELIKLNINNLKLENEDFLNFNNEKKFDLIISNPPYFVLDKKNIDKSYFKYFDGRPNMFILFIIKSLFLLNNNGILSFILPKNFLNCFYYNKLRLLIYNNYKILNIIIVKDNYLETKQETIIFILQNNNENKNNINYSFELNSNYIIFNSKENIIKIKDLYKNSKTLKELNFDVKIGSIVWNQYKDILTDDDTKTKLIYNTDIINNKLILKKYKNKKNYINKKGKSDIIILLNRGFGISNYNLEYLLLEEENYLIENHLIIIEYKDKNIDKNKLKDVYNKIINSFKNPKTKEFISLFFNNNGINCFELLNLFPIYLNEI